MSPNRIPDGYFDALYDAAEDPWELSTRWYDQRKYAITLAMLPMRRYRHVLEIGCSIGAFTQLLSQRSEEITATDIASKALAAADRRLREAGCRGRVNLVCRSLDELWPTGPFDLVVLSEVAYYLDSSDLQTVVDREFARLQRGATVIAAHWRHLVEDYPISGDKANEIICRSAQLSHIAQYKDDDVLVDLCVVGDARSVATRERIPGAGGVVAS